MNTLAITRPDTLGPYFPPTFAPGDRLAMLRPGSHEDEDVIAIDMRILDRDGKGATNVLVEGWQPDGAGHRHPNADPRLASIGRLLSRNGALEIRTVRPRGEAGRAGWITLTFYCDGLERLATQIFLADDPLLGDEPLLGVLPVERVPLLVASSIAAQHYAIDIRLSGEGETPFFILAGALSDVALSPYPGDNTSVERTPLRPLIVVPDAIKQSFAPDLQSVDLPEAAASTCDLIDQARAIELSGRVLDTGGAPRAGVVIELWAANAGGRYRHPDDHTDPPLDPDYDGFGRVRTDDEGRYRFRLIAPGAYLARPDIGRWRPGHIHISLIGGSARLVTQLYFPNDPHHDPDPMRIAHGDAFDNVILRPDAAVAGRYFYDFVVA